VFVRTAVQNSIGWIELNRPPVNAFEWTMVSQTADALDAFEDDPQVRVLVLASALERYFSAGADLQTFRELGEKDMDRWCELVHGIVGKLRHSTKPILAAISGVAVGGGLEMALHCDVRFAARNARLGQPEININFIPRSVPPRRWSGSSVGPPPCATSTTARSSMPRRRKR